MKKYWVRYLLIMLFIVTLLFSSGAVFAEAQLVAVVELTRHGDRTPFDQIVNSPVHWTSGASELTPLGMQQEYQLGQLLRSRYIVDLKFLPERYEAGSMFVQSSDTNRTIMSADCLLAGMYPPGTGPLLDNGQPALPDRLQMIPVRTVPADSAAIMIPYPSFLKIMQENVYSQQAWLAMEKASSKEYARWSKILGNRINNLGDVMTVGDVLIVRDKHGIALPSGLSRKDADKIIELNDWALAFEFKSEKVSYLCGGELLNKIAADINNAVAGKAAGKFIYYSGHDISILPVMTLLGKPLSEPPGYAAHMGLELVKDNGGYFVRLRYDNRQEAEYTLAQFNEYVGSANSRFRSAS